MNQGETASTVAGTRHIVYSRPYQPGDEAQIVELYNKVTGRSRTVEQHRWEWLDGPEGPGSIWVIEWEEEGKKKIIGHHGLIPVPMIVFGKKVLAGKTENTMVDPDYQDKILYLRFEQSFLHEAKQRFDLLFTTTGSGSPGRIRRKLGYMPVAPYEEFVKPKGNQALDRMARSLLRSLAWFNEKAVLRDALCPLCKAMLKVYFWQPKRILPEVEVSEHTSLGEITDELDRFLDRNNRLLGIGAKRTSSYLNWRFFENPHVQHRVLVGRRHGELAGYAIVRRLATHHVRIADIVVDNRDKVLFDAFMASMENELSRLGFDTFQYLGLRGRNWLNISFQRNGYRRLANVRRRLGFISAEETRFLALPIGDAAGGDLIAKADYWYFSEIFLEGI